MRHQFGGPEPDNYPMMERIARERASPMRQAKIDTILREVAELPDRTSPDDWPEAMLVTRDELRAILTAHL